MTTSATKNAPCADHCEHDPSWMRNNECMFMVNTMRGAEQYCGHECAAIHRAPSGTDAEEDTCPRCGGSFSATGGKPEPDCEPYVCQKCWMELNDQASDTPPVAEAGGEIETRKPTAAEVLGLLTVHLLQEHWDEAREIASEIRIDFATNPARVIAIDFVSTPDAEVDAEVGRLQNGIRDYLIQQHNIPDDRIDGAGCDSGDPLDFTTAEIGQAIAFLTDAHDAEVARLREALRHMLNIFDRELPENSIGANVCAAARDLLDGKE